MDNDCTFEIPNHICELMGIDWCDDDMKKYMVKGDGSLWLPWNTLFGDDERWHGILTEATYLLDNCQPVLYKEYKKRIEILINFHENKFDYSQGRVES